jgi:hypothetical protein
MLTCLLLFAECLPGGARQRVVGRHLRWSLAHVTVAAANQHAQQHVQYETDQEVTQIPIPISDSAVIDSDKGNKCCLGNGLRFEAHTSLDARKLVLKFWVMELACLYASVVALKLSGSLLNVLVSKLTTMSVLIRDAVDCCLDAFHDLLTYKRVLLSLNLVLQVTEILVREDSAQLVDDVLLSLQLWGGLLEFHLSAVELSGDLNLRL